MAALAGGHPHAPTIFPLRAFVAAPLCDKFDHWTSTGHLPRAVVMLVEERGGYPPNKSPALISDAHLRAIGAICVIWSTIEMAMELAILGLYQIDHDRGLPLTSNIGFQSRLALLRILAMRGAIKDPIEAKACEEILNRIEKAYPKRNEAAHGLWAPTKSPLCGSTNGHPR